MNPGNFFAELKRRNVYKVAVAYAIVAWLLIQAASILFPTFEAPAWVMKVFVTAIAFGFPVALVLAWAFELTPEGIKRAEDVSPNESNTRKTGRKLVGMTATLAVLAAGLWGFQFWRAKSATPAGRLATPAPTATLPAIPEKSIAVLPFGNLSRDPENAYFSEGIQDEILTRLAKIGALKVISRTSTAHYASAPNDLPAIARQLGVANILEGSVQKVGDQARISVQLIQASSDTHLWAETYDRKLTDIFGVESEVAKAIADALQARLTGSEQQELALKPTDNAEAYDAYLHGRTFEARIAYDQDALKAATRFFSQATQLDPRFAQAWARLSKVNALAVFGLLDGSPARREASKQALDKAVELQPHSTETQLAQAFYRFWIERDFAAAKRMFEQLRARLPGSSEVPSTLSSIARRQGLWDQSLAYSDQAIALDPRDPVLLTERAFTYSVSRRYAEAIKTMDRRLEITPGDPDTIAFQARLYQTQGELDQARRLLGRLSSDEAIPSVTGTMITQSLLEHDYHKTVELLTAELAKPESAVGLTGATSRAALGFAQMLFGDVVAAKATNLRARREFEGLREQDPDNALLAGRLALVYAALGEKDRALKEGERAMTLLPGFRDALYGPSMEERLAAVEAQGRRKRPRHWPLAAFTEHRLRRPPKPRPDHRGTAPARPDLGSAARRSALSEADRRRRDAAPDPMSKLSFFAELKRGNEDKPAIRPRPSLIRQRQARPATAA